MTHDYFVNQYNITDCYGLNKDITYSKVKVK